MKGLLCLVVAIAVALSAGAAVFAGGVEGVPNLSASYTSPSTQVWIVQNGKVCAKFNDADFLRGESIRVGSVTLIDQTFCRPQAPPQPFAPPAFENPVVTPPPAVDVAAPASGPSLLDIILHVAGIAAGFYFGRKTADDDADEVEDEKAPA